ncbi:MAG: heavy metal translocating P-type ATPase [Absicoccus sp.]|uniref:Cd(2+)-exporting ATPase n=1 Tax=Absicoccus intestinalis TaxID=2926319 RepID=A0ABU4WMW9_9FIRM|nr:MULTISPECIES: heavy metal translocating P-type ATPase [unclassified Absicoccus]MDX8416832.1 cadmium-translocating P-type ATPase [Absicoccus sp. CLA-KB-P134]MDY3035620.1 heavy metal translocating P-type ATPase [Absicoccus sp.]
MNKKQKQNLIRILLSTGLLIVLYFIPVSGWMRFLLYMIPYLIIGYDILWKAIKGIIHRQPFDECLLMAIATVGAIALAIRENGDYTEAIAVMLFYQVGEWFQSYAVGKSRKNITDLMDIAPEYANLERDGHLEQVDPDEIEIGSILVVKTGEKIPIDGVVLDGDASLDTTALTGESIPRSVHKGDEVISGCINTDGVLRIRTTKAFEDSTVAKVLELVEDASSHKSHSENFITKFARIYTPIVVYSAIALAFIPPLIQCMMHTQPQWGTYLYRALIFLVVSCPCALVISIPLSFFAGIGSASHEGVLVKGSNYLELLSEIKTVVFDKTGTLTKGVFEVTNIHPEKISADELLHMAAHVERYSTHPIANSLKKAYPNEADACSISDAKEIAGQGMQAIVNGKLVCVGNAKMMDAMGISWQNCLDAGTIVHIAIDGVYAGHIHISDVVKPHTKQAISELRKNGVSNIVMLTGDSRSVAQRVAQDVGIQNVYSELLPQDKVKKVEDLLQNKAKETDRLAFVGDGINDAPVLSRADIGVAMGAMGSDAAIEAADVVLMDDDPLKLATAIHISRKCLRIVKENIWFAIGIKVLCLVLSAFGLTNMWVAIFADVGVMILAVLNAMRCMFIHSIEPID